MSTDNIKVIGGPLDGQYVDWMRAVVMLKQPRDAEARGRIEGDEEGIDRFTYARFSRPSGTFYAPHHWTWEDVLAHLAKY